MNDKAIREKENRGRTILVAPASRRRFFCQMEQALKSIPGVSRIGK
jgi:hypothetical protein